MPVSLDEKRSMIEPNGELPMREQCMLLGMSVSSYYYRSKSSPEDEWLMALLDGHYLAYPCEGKEKHARWLSKRVGFTVGKRRVRSLMVGDCIPKAKYKRTP